MSLSARTRLTLKSHSALLPCVVQVYAISDLHTDVLANFTWLREYSEASKAAHKNDVIVVAGDISDSIDKLRATLAVLKATFGAGVAFVPGNHDLWCSPSSGGNSLDKLADILRVCAELGVHTRPFLVVSDTDEPTAATTSADDDGWVSPSIWDDDADPAPLLVVPLMSWYVEVETTIYCVHVEDHANMCA